MSTPSFKGAFLGFEFNGIHSSTYNIVVVSGGNRFDRNLLPQSQDSTTNIPGRDGLFFFDSNFQPVTFNLKIAYDNVSEMDIRNITKWLSDKAVHDLVFDEYPWKVYSCKVTGQPKLSFIPFENSNKIERTYKGEGEIQFQAFYPFAKARYKSEVEFNTALGTDLNIFSEKSEWMEASGLPTTRTGSPAYDYFNASGVAQVLNPGDIASPIIIPEFAVQTATGYLSITYSEAGTLRDRMILDLSKLTAGNHYRLDGEKQLILGFDYSGGSYKLNNRVYNQCIAAGRFFKIKPNPKTVTQTVVISPFSSVAVVPLGNGFHLDYDYLYF